MKYRTTVEYKGIELEVEIEGDHEKINKGIDIDETIIKYGDSPDLSPLLTNYAVWMIEDMAIEKLQEE